MKNSTQKIKPVGYNVDLKYQCPQCGSDHWITQQEAKTTGFRIVCCNKQMVIEPVHKFTLDVVFKSQLNTPTQTVVQAQVTDSLKNGREALNKLIKLGFEGVKYQTLALTLSQQGDDVETIMRKCIAHE